MNSYEIRKKFLSYFESLNHKVIPSDSLIPSSDKTLLFTTAGMVQFKDYFLAKRTDLKRACSVQKCLRTSDLEKVGKSAYHLTFFEMLGNFSFGDYFKKEAIEWAWDFITNTIKLDKNKIYITVYKDDQESYEIWSKIIEKERIYKMSEETNFWKMGDVGPCGPCSEILYDLGEDFGCKKPLCGIGCDCSRYIEIWNLVFTQFDLQIDGTLVPLRQKNIDTGMGLERLNMVMNNLNNVFETDLFLPIKNELYSYLSNSIKDIKNTNYINSILDHIRSATFAISEGVIPTNESRGYVVRKIIRRAVRYLKLLNHNQPLLYKLVPKVVEVMKDVYPELELHKQKVALIIKSEEEKFLETLDQGLEIINDILKKSKSQISGEVVFKLYDTYGFPKELVDEILKENNIYYNQEEFLEALNKSKQISFKSWQGTKVINKSLYKNFSKTDFIGYEEYFCKSKLLGIIKNNEIIKEATAGDEVELIFEKTPFYGELGGQIGDSGVIKEQSNIIAEVIDTKNIDGVIVHIAKLNKEIKIEKEFILQINLEKRKDIMRHHTATHLLHQALKSVLGQHVVQYGSLVSDNYFRFDFLHWRALDSNEINKIEKVVNEKILECLKVDVIYSSIDIAKKLNAVALFEEKYEKNVRMIAIGGKILNDEILEQPFSLELCGGTHCKNTGEIGIFKVIKEYSVGTNIRRIEAICGNRVYDYLNNLQNFVNHLNITLSTSSLDDIKLKIEKLIHQNNNLKKEIENLKLNLSSNITEELIKDFNSTKFIINKFYNTDLKFIRSFSDRIIKKYDKEPTVIFLYCINKNNISFVIRLNEIALQNGLKARKFAESLSKFLNLKYGGRDDFIQGGGIIQEDFTNEKIFDIIKK